MTFQDQQLNSMTFQAWKIKFLNSMTVQVFHDLYEPCQRAKKIIFTACHLGKLKLAFTSPDVISTSPKSFLMSRIDFTVLVI